MIIKQLHKDEPEFLELGGIIRGYKLEYVHIADEEIFNRPRFDLEKYLYESILPALVGKSVEISYDEATKTNIYRRR